MLPTTAEKLQNFFGVFLQFQIGVDTETANALAEKPAKRWDGLVDKLIYAFALAVVAWVAAGMPGLK